MADFKQTKKSEFIDDWSDTDFWGRPTHPPAVGCCQDCRCLPSPATRSCTGTPSRHACCAGSSTAGTRDPCSDRQTHTCHMTLSAAKLWHVTSTQPSAGYGMLFWKETFYSGNWAVLSIQTVCWWLITSSRYHLSRDAKQHINIEWCLHSWVKLLWNYSGQTLTKF